jgi:hypothetical protein
MKSGKPESLEMLLPEDVCRYPGVYEGKNGAKLHRPATLLTLRYHEHPDQDRGVQLPMLGRTPRNGVM